MILKLSTEINTGARAAPTPQGPSSWCSHTGQPMGSRLGSRPHRRSDLPRDPKDPGGAGLQVRGSKEDTGRPHHPDLSILPRPVWGTCVHLIVHMHTCLSPTTPAAPAPGPIHTRPCPSRWGGHQECPCPSRSLSLRAGSPGRRCVCSAPRLCHSNPARVSGASLELEQPGRAWALGPGSERGSRPAPAPGGRQVCQKHRSVVCGFKMLRLLHASAGTEV